MNFRQTMCALAAGLLLINLAWADADPVRTEQLYQQALDAWHANDWVTAEARLSELVASQPDHYDAQLKLGGIYLTSQRVDAAIGAFQRAVGIDDQNGLGFTALSLAYLHKGAYGPARAAAESAAALLPQEEGPKKLIAFIDARVQDGGSRTAHP